MVRHIDRMRTLAGGRIDAAKYRFSRLRAESRYRRAYSDYWSTGTIPSEAGELLNLAFWSSGGTLPAALAREFAPPWNEASADSLNDDLLSGLDSEVAARAISENGFYVHHDLIDTALIDQLQRRLAMGPADPLGDGTDGVKSGPPSSAAPTWWMQLEHIIDCPGVQKLLLERNLIQTASRYLQTDPVLESLVMWSTYPWARADSASAQMFHFDLDRSHFVKAFIYLTDVGEDNGPHVYVAGSHHDKPKDLLRGGRIDDRKLAKFYSPESWQQVTGPRGTLFFADTRGFHKGTQVLSGSRSILQFNIASDRFGFLPVERLGGHDSLPRNLRAVDVALPRFFDQLYEPNAQRP